MPRLNAANNAKTTLAQNIDASATSFDVVDASVFPAVPFRLTILDSGGNPAEIMEIGTITSNTLSDIQRGLEGTSAASHNSGVFVVGRFTAGMYDELVSQDEFGAHKADNALQGVHDIATTQDITYYVDSSSGSDSNDGSSGSPFATIQYAINQLPPIINHKVNIELAAGTYDETIDIEGFVGKGEINIHGDTVVSDNYSLNRIVVANCGASVYVRGIRDEDTGNNFLAVRCNFVKFSYCKPAAADDSSNGILVIASFCVIEESIIDNKASAIKAERGSVVYSNNNDGSNNTYGLNATSAATIGKNSTQPSGTTADEQISSGGEIR